MAKTETIRKEISNRIQAIDDKHFLLFLEEIINSYSRNESEKDFLTEEQEEMLKLSEEDLKYGRTISQEDLQKKTSEWLQKRNF